jgi:hypothetical protein
LRRETTHNSESTVSGGKPALGIGRRRSRVRDPSDVAKRAKGVPLFANTVADRLRRRRILTWIKAMSTRAD